ncbi:hypothetical protein ACH5RR_029971 [Cinchona calisaya]|uniref:Bet v I/Major latex protein domain-containing protein n=1 Tax=Cinchona calisaya TaxID=153742 RepID=A0ABD2YWT1_9GENT
MSLSGRLVSQIEVKSNADVFHEIFAYKPHHLANAFPDIVHSFSLLKGAWGTVGSVVFGTYTLEGKKNMVKATIDAVDDSTKLITYKVIEGDLMKLYKTISVTLQVDTHGDEKFVTWTMEYLKLSPSIPDPNSLMDLALTITKGIENQNHK